MINFNGTLVEIIKASIPVSNRGLNYGDAIFETLRVSGGRIYFWEDHYFRLMASMRILRMEIPMNFSQEYLEEQVLATVEANGRITGAYRIKILVWRQEGGLYSPTSNNIEFSIQCSDLEQPFYLLHEGPYEVELFKDHYITSGLLSTLKTNNKIINVLGSIFAKENGYENCLLINEKKQVVEALNGNLFLVKGETIKTPPLADGCLKGILRKQLLSILVNMHDYEIEESSISPFELQKADELFVTNVITGIQSITKYRKKEYTNTMAKELLGKLNVKARLG
jgi:branched-chain amino acid aminotransferase